MTYRPAHTTSFPAGQSRTRGCLPCGCLTLLGTSVLLAFCLAAICIIWIWHDRDTEIVIPPQQGCTVTVDQVTSFLDWEQSGNAAIIAAESIRRSLPPRATSIALVTAYQESGIRNLDYGDLDSVGIFQQRPSQGWGSVEQIMDPWYSSGQFYDHLVRVPDWESGVINDVAQAVQRSGFPDAYGQHEPQGRAWASAMRGYSPASITCIDRESSHVNIGQVQTFLNDVFGDQLTMIATDESHLYIDGSDETVWAAASLAMMTRPFKITSIALDDRIWIHDPYGSSWQHDSQADSRRAEHNARLIIAS